MGGDVPPCRGKVIAHDKQLQNKYTDGSVLPEKKLKQPYEYE